ncbi:hypothetical protein EDC01DRAFT_224689 [Geopyxis carbonaria]|nr:hypothetical protein EDC01DRAFT_224689 [Geopyxis carbonaria]
MRNLQIIIALLLTFTTLSVSDPGSGDPFGRELWVREASPQRATSGKGEPFEGDVSPTTTDTQATTATGKADESNAKTTAKADKTNSGDKSSATGDTKKNKESASDKKTTTRKVRVPATAVVGAVNMKTPAAQDGFSIFKIGETVTFGWNYTDLVVSPTNVNVEAYCTDGANYFTITGNASGDTTKAIWDTGKYQATASIKLPIATYTLFIYDASKSRTDVASPGYLGVYQNLRFGLYEPKKAIPLSQFECPTCSPDGANALLNKYALRMSLLMAFLSTISFAWFMAGAL